MDMIVSARNYSGWGLTIMGECSCAREDWMSYSYGVPRDGGGGGYPIAWISVVLF